MHVLPPLLDTHFCYSASLLCFLRTPPGHMDYFAYEKPYIFTPGPLQREEIERLVKEVSDKWGTLEVLVNK